jgi:hypothetical protein
MKKPVVSFPWGDVEVPMRPNFIRQEMGMVPVYKFTDKALRMIAKAWTDELLAKARAERKRRLKNGTW